MPDEAVARALKNKDFDKGKIYVVVAGKAGWQMAKQQQIFCRIGSNQGDV